WTEIGNGLEIVFKNSSKDSETIDLLIYVTVDGVKDLQELDLGIDGGAIIDSLRIDLCDNAFNVLSNYATRNLGTDRATISVDGEDIALQASEIGASCVKFTVTIRDWSADTEHHFVVVAGGAEGPPPGEGEGEPTGEPNVYILYNEELGVLTFFNFSFIEGELFITFSNETADSSTVEILIIAEPRAVEFLTGFNASIDNGATIESVSIDFYDNDFNFIEHYQAYDFGTPECSVPFNSREAIGAMENATADLIGFKIVIGNWVADTTYTLHIIPFFSELLYYETEDTIYVDPSVANLPPEIRVWWRLYNDSWGWTWSYRDISWEFGPKARYDIFCYNATTGWYLVTPDTWIALNAPVKVNITIPKMLFEEGTELGRIEMNWYMYAINISASLTISYDYSSDWWYTQSSISNWSDTSGSSSTGEFFTLNRTQTTMSEDTEKYEFTIVGQFNDLTPKGIYYVSLSIWDNESNYIRGSSYWWESESSLYREVAVGGPWDEVAVYFDIMYGGTYIAEILNTDYELIRSIGVNQTFIIRLNVTGISDEEFSNASVIIQLPWSMKIYVNVTGWHEEYRVYHGGWVYDETSDTYVWDPNATIITREWVFGPYLKEQWIELERKEFNVTYYWWNDTAGEYEASTEIWYAQPELLLFYDNANNNFTYYLLYEYWNSTLKESEWGQYVEYRRQWEIEEVPPELKFYEFINGTKTVEENKIVLEFKGKFVGKLGEDLYLEYRVFSIDRELYPRNYTWIENHATVISVEKPVVSVRIRDQNGKTARDWYYATDPNQWFIVEVEVEGGSSLVTDVDGVRVRFSCWDWYWSESEAIWSNVEIITTINFRENTSEVIVYNETHKEVYGDDTYEYYSFNQTSGEWVTEWIGGHHKDTVINKPYLVVNNYTAFTTEDGRYLIRVNMSFTEHATNQQYSFDVKLLNWTYGPDWTQPWMGEHLVEEWIHGVVYTIKNGSVEVYVPTPTMTDYVETSTGKKYLVVRKPYIMINGEKLPLKEIKYWNGQEYEYRLLVEEWDPATQKCKRYYILENGTKVFVYEAYHVIIYTATIYDSNSGETYDIITYMKSPRWDWRRGSYFLVDVSEGGIGEVIWLSSYNDFMESEKIGRMIVEFGGYYTLVNGTIWLNVSDGFFHWDTEKLQNYLLLENGTRIYLEYDDEYMYMYYFEGEDGKRYYVEWPSKYYVGEYDGKSIIVPEDFLLTWYYTIVGGEKVELPYEGVSYEYEGFWRWSSGPLQQPKSVGGVVPEDDYALVNGSLYLIHYDEGSENGYINVDGNIIHITKNKGLYTKVSGIGCWDIVETGFTFFLGNLTEKGIYDRDSLIELHAASYDGAGTITLLNGTPLTVTKNVRVVFYNVTVNGTIYYTANAEPYEYYIWENNTYVYTLYLINGSKLELKNLDDFEFVGVVILELGESTGYIPDTFTWSKTGETYNTTIQTDRHGFICLAYLYYRVYIDTNVWYDLVPLDWYLQTDRQWGVPPRYHYDDLGSTYDYPYSPDYSYTEDLVIYNVTINGVVYTAYPNVTHIKVVRVSWGQPVTWHLEELQWGDVSYRYEIWSVIVGSPEWGLWGYRKWTIDPETGALDLDGDLSTTNDQFYVKRVYEGEFGWNETRQGLDVGIVYDPNPVVPGDELFVNAWMGIAVNTYWNRWNETYYWFYTNMTPVSPETMAWINETLW
ncbi:hypothetical protein DRO69_08180, partial [Candidatus Bathyarchaeota archaeon]